MAFCENTGLHRFHADAQKHTPQRRRSQLGDNRGMLTRQKALLRLIANGGTHIGKTRLQKLAFLLRDEITDSPTSQVYQFVPYQFGPYSFTLSHELKSLESDGFIRISEQDIHLLDGVQVPVVDKQLAYSIDTLSRRFAAVKTDVLVSTVYKRFPWYTCNARDKAKRLAKPIHSPLAIYTVGYEGLMLEGLLDLLLQNGIERLIDVRANPVARRFGFHKSTLLRHCSDLNIDYVHIPELGIASSERAGLVGSKEFEALFCQYEAGTLKRELAAIARATSLIREKPSALLCMEADCTSCHRSRLAVRIREEIELPILELRKS